jgi:hypothetical protein
MYGGDTGTLNIVVKPQGNTTNTTVWMLNGDQGQSWYNGKAPIFSGQPFYVSLTPSFLSETCDLWTPLEQAQSVPISGMTSFQVYTTLYKCSLGPE